MARQQHGKRKREQRPDWRAATAEQLLRGIDGHPQDPVALHVAATRVAAACNERAPDLATLRLALRVDPHHPGLVCDALLRAALTVPADGDDNDAVRLYDMATLPGDALKRALGLWSSDEAARAAAMAPWVLELAAAGRFGAVDWRGLRRAGAAFDALVARAARPAVPALVVDPGAARLAVHGSLVWLWLKQLGVELDADTPPLGSGTYGVVYRGTHAGRRVAVKLAVPHGEHRAAEDVVHEETDTPARVGRHAAEAGTARAAAAAARVTGFVATAVLPGAAAGDARGVAVLVMPLAVGSLLSVLRDDASEDLQPPLTCAERVAIIADVALGLQAAHDAGRVACDLKPANVLLFDRTRTGARGGRDLVARLSDFGMDGDASDSGSCRGTPLYTATRRSYAAGDYQRPTSAAWDWFVFAKVVVLTLARVDNPDNVARAIVTAPVGRLRRQVDDRWHALAGNDGGRPVPLQCGPDEVARAAVGWAVKVLALGEKIDPTTGSDDGAWLPGVPAELRAAIDARAATGAEDVPATAVPRLALLPPVDGSASV